MRALSFFLKKGVANLPKNSKVKADQIRTLDKARLVKHIGSLEQDEMERVEGAMRIHLGEWCRFVSR